MSRVVLALVVAGMLAVAAACGGSAGSSSGSGTATGPTSASGGVSWPAPLNPMQLAIRAGLTPEVREELAFHVHSHLDVFVNGSSVTVPSGIGINIHDPNVKHGPDPKGGTDYGGITGCATPCVSPLHTHDPSGWLHTESPGPTSNRLGQLFVEWNVRLDRSCVGGYCTPKTTIRFFVDGTPYTGDPRTIELSDLREIAIVIGTPPASVPSTVPAA